MAGELREENMRNAETANIWGTQTEEKKWEDTVVQKQKKKIDPIFCSTIPPALGS